eukprot:TRINITY_DN1869_c0_g1_i12.p1 TRINITY_DN1869_c0_g1~~TRINITY_DN1869_c0_g1_i12.p1  ORF type:complete len:211 (-),score=19.80 TRINITY_DN1869_c0_g1_i12:641-1273(-)
MFLIAFFLVSVKSSFVGAGVLPHGDFVYDPQIIGGKNGSEKLHQAAIQLGEWVDSLQPDIIFITTPHGISSHNNFLIYVNSNGSGFAPIGQDLENNCTIGPVSGYDVNMQIPLDQQFAHELFNSLEGKIDTLGAFADSLPIAISWGEIIPLSFFSCLTAKTCHAIIMSIPTRRLTEPVKMIPELINLGLIGFLPSILTVSLLTLHSVLGR